MNRRRRRFRKSAEKALTAEQLRELLTKLRSSATCMRRDLVDPITVLIATGLPLGAAGAALA